MVKKVAIIIGGCDKLAEAMSAKLADSGYSVALTYSASDLQANPWLGSMHARGYDLRAFGWYPCDVSDEASWRSCISAVIADRGPIDILINTAELTGDMTLDWNAVLCAPNAAADIMVANRASDTHYRAAVATSRFTVFLAPDARIASTA